MKTEVDAVIGDDGYVTFEDLSKLKYTTAVSWVLSACPLKLDVLLKEKTCGDECNFAREHAILLALAFKKPSFALCPGRGADLIPR